MRWVVLAVLFFLLTPAFVNAQVSHPAKDITPGNFTGDFRVTGVLTVGNVAGGLFGATDRTYILSPSGAVKFSVYNDRVYVADKLGIGTANPSAHVEISASNEPQLRVSDTTNNVFAAIRATNTEARLGSVSNHPIVFEINALEKARFDTNGNLGIGTSSPTTLLDITRDFGANANPTLRWRNSYAGGSGGSATIELGAKDSLAFLFTNHNGGVTARIDHDPSNLQAFDIATKGNLYLGTGASFTRRLVVNTDGNVGIGTTSPQGRLDVSNGKIVNVADPTSAQDAATKNYVDTKTSSSNGLTPMDLYSIQYNGAGQVSSDGTSVTFKDVVGGASCTDLAGVLGIIQRDQYNFFPSTSEITPKSGVTWHIKNEAEHKVNVAVLNDNGCGGGAFRHAGMILGMTSDVSGSIAKFRASNASMTNVYIASLQYDDNDNRIWAVLNDGSGTASRTDTGYTVSTAGGKRTYEIVLKGTTGADYYINGNLVASISKTMKEQPMALVFNGLGNQDTAANNTATVYSINVWKE